MKTGHNYYVYIVQCSDGSYYTGVSNDLERRMWEHNEGYDATCYTYKRRPVVLKYSEHYHNIKNAIAREKQLKGWSRKKKEALFREDWEELKKLSKSRLRQAQPDITNEMGQSQQNLPMSLLNDARKAQPDITPKDQA